MEWHFLHYLVPEFEQFSTAELKLFYLPKCTIILYRAFLTWKSVFEKIEFEDSPITRLFHYDIYFFNLSAFHVYKNNHPSDGGKVDQKDQKILYFPRYLFTWNLTRQSHQFRVCTTFNCTTIFYSFLKSILRNVLSLSLSSFVVSSLSRERCTYRRRTNSHRSCDRIDRGSN